MFFSTPREHAYETVNGFDRNGYLRMALVVMCSCGGMVWLLDTGRLCMETRHLRECLELQQLVGQATGLGGEA